MYECPNCGANIKYDIKLQKMLCAFCDSTFDPYEVAENHKADEHVYAENALTGEVKGRKSESDVMQVTVYTCSQCGGEIIGDENEAATFCSYCGASTIMNGRIERTAKPQKILPFKISKDDCARAYKKMVGKALFAPDYIKDPKRIEGFRGIYMPYWLYDMDKKGRVNYSATRTYQKGDYEYTEHYNISAYVDAAYEGMNYDASSSFSDRLSNSIAPFYSNQDADFTTAFMSGFYADVMDVKPEIYRNDATMAARKDVADRLVAKTPKGRYSISEGSAVAAVKMNVKKETLAMFPVWFMSYRTKDKKGEERVLYTVINGQTGKAAGDLPVDLKKYIIGSLLIAVPVFVLLNLFLTMKPVSMLILALLLMIVCLVVSNEEIYAIAKQDLQMDDRGYLSKMGLPKADKRTKGVREQNAELKKLEKKYRDELSYGNGILFIVCLIFGLGLWFFKPVSDWWYYFGGILCGLCDCRMLISIMKLYNRRLSRPLPQFKRKGGDDDANISKDI